MQIDYSKCNIAIIQAKESDINKALAAVNGYPFIGRNILCSFGDILNVVSQAEFLFNRWVLDGVWVGDVFEKVSGSRNEDVRRSTYVRIKKRAKHWYLVSVSRAVTPVTPGFCLIPFTEMRRVDLYKSHPELKRINQYGNEKPLRANNCATRTRRSKAGKASPATDTGPGGGDSAHQGPSVASMGGGGSQDAPGIVGVVPD